MTYKNLNLSFTTPQVRNPHKLPAAIAKKQHEDRVKVKPLKPKAQVVHG